MFLNLAHTKLNAFKISQEMALETYKVTKLFPAEEKFALVQQIRRTAISVHLNLAEGCSRKSEVERKRYFEISRGSVIEVDAALEIAYKLSYVSREELAALGDLLITTFKLLSGIITKITTHN